MEALCDVGVRELLVHHAGRILDVEGEHPALVLRALLVDPGSETRDHRALVGGGRVGEEEAGPLELAIREKRLLRPVGIVGDIRGAVGDLEKDVPYSTVKLSLLVKLPLGVVIVIGPLVAPLGTSAQTPWLEATTKLVAGVPLKSTAVVPSMSRPQSRTF